MGTTVVSERRIETVVPGFPFVTDQLKAYLAEQGVAVHGVDVRGCETHRAELVVLADRDVSGELAVFQQTHPPASLGDFMSDEPF